MTNTVIGVFNTRQDAENATYKLRNEGFNTENISIVGGSSDDAESSDNAGASDNISNGVTAGTILGGVAGLLIGAGTFAIPGLGVVAAAGPLAGLISGAVTGGVVGALVDLGIPENESKGYEDHIKTGKYILTVKTEGDNVDAVKSVISNYGATDVNVY